MRSILGCLGALLILVFVLFVISQTAQIVTLASTVDPAFGRAVLLALLITYAVLVGVPILLFLRLPRPLIPPAEDGGPAQARYLAGLAARLARNPALRGREIALTDRASLEAALEVLHAQAREHIARTASSVFVTTALSQSGRLDALMVLVAQTRMLWQIAHLYWQRPSLRELIHLYANVAATAFAVQSVEDLDPTENLEQLLAPVLAGSAVAVIPGFSVMARVVIDAVLEGTVNAFLTLRIGCIANQQCRSLVVPERRTLRRAATVQAGAMLGEIAVRGAHVVAAAMAHAASRVATEKSAELGRTVLRGAETLSAASVEFTERLGVDQLAARLRDLAVAAARRAASVVAEAARKGTSLNPFRKKSAGAEEPGAS